MNAHQLALQETRSALLQTFNSTDLLELWKLNFLYSLHFQGSTPPHFDDIANLVQSEPPAFWFVSPMRIFEMWQKQRILRQEAARSVADLLKGNIHLDTITRAHQNMIDYCLRAIGLSADDHANFRYWALSHLLYSLTSDDIRQGQTELAEGKSNIPDKTRFQTFFQETQT